MFLFLLIIPINSCVLSRYFTDCENNKMSVIYYPEANCTQEIPSPIHNLSCTKICDPGYRLDLSNDKKLICSECPEGTYSLGGGLWIGQGGIS